MKVAVMGAGAVGCYFGARLARAGHDVTLIARPAHVKAIAQHGLVFESGGTQDRIPVQATVEPSGVTGADVVLFCVKSTDTESAGQSIALHLKPDATVLCLQNGVDNHARLQPLIAPVAVPAAVYVAVEMAGPGHVRHHGRGDIVIGASPASAEIARHFNNAEIQTTVSDRVIDTLWTKLTTNCAYNALSAVAELPYGPILEVEGVAEVIRSVVDECVAVARAAGVSLPPDILETILALPATMPNQYSSTAQDLARGKPSEIDHLNGYVVRKGVELGIPTPANLALQVMVKLREARQQPTG
ncbi:ketopantoate reductase family protein [Afipia sp. TerB]